MKKIIFSFFISFFSFLSFVSAGEVDLEQCSSYYDGCNTCSVIGGEIWACTERYCVTYDEPKCLSPKSDEVTKQEAFCTEYEWVYEESSQLCYFGNKEILSDTLYNSYMDFSGQMMYMGGSKYFDERTGFYDYDAVRSDLNVLWFVRLNIPKLYKEYNENIDMKMNSLQSKLNEIDETRQKFVEELGEKIVSRVDQIVEKFVDSTSGMSHAKKEKYLIKKVEILWDIREKFEKNTSKKYQKAVILIDYFIYKLERFIAYE